MKNWEAPSSVPMSDVPTARSENVSSTVWLHLETKPNKPVSVAGC